MNPFVLLLTASLILTGCLGATERPLLPLKDAPKRETLREVPPDGVIRLEPGDTIYTIANRYQVSPRRIILANRLAPPYDLSQATTINIPKPRAHRVQQGDTLESISRRYRVSIPDVISLNALTKPYTLRPGMDIAIPRRLDYTQLEALAAPAQAAQPSAPAVSLGKKAVRPKTPLQAVRFSDAADDFTWPVDGDIVDRFGAAGKGVHNDGVNIAASVGTPVRASFDGEVAFVGAGLKSFGNLVLIKHDGGWITAYAHLESVAVSEGDRIRRGTVIGAVGQTGRVDSPQLHFELRRSRKPVDPEEYLS